MLRRPGRMLSVREASNIDFHESAVFVQMRGGNVVTGTIRRNNRSMDNLINNVPGWMPRRSGPARQERVFLFIPTFMSLNANIGVLVHEKNNTSIHRYNLIIKTLNGDVFQSHLLPEPPDLSTVVTPYIYVRMSDYNIIYGGELEWFVPPNIPKWIF